LDNLDPPWVYWKTWECVSAKVSQQGVRIAQQGMKTKHENKAQSNKA